MSSASPEAAAKAVAADAFFRYEHALQKECEPELTIQLPAPASDPLEVTPITLSEPNLEGAPPPPANGVISVHGPHTRGNEDVKGDGVANSDSNAARLMPPPPPPPQVGGHKGGAGVEGRRVILVRVEYQVVKPASGIRFRGDYAVTDNEVRLP